MPGSTSNGRGVSATETPREGATEVWEVANLTGDAHPIHIHLIQFQVISRQPFDVDTYLTDWMAAFPGGTFNGFTFPPGVYIPGFGPPLNYTDPQPRGRAGRQPELRRRQVPAAGRLRGRRLPVARARGDRRGLEGHDQDVPGRDHAARDPLGAAGRAGERHRSPGQDLFPFDPTNPPGYIEHCHILDHEDNEFMRPLPGRQVAGDEALVADDRTTSGCETGGGVCRRIGSRSSSACASCC